MTYIVDSLPSGGHDLIDCVCAGTYLNITLTLPFSLPSFLFLPAPPFSSLPPLIFFSGDLRPAENAVSVSKRVCAFF